MFVEKVYQIITWDPCAKQDPTIAGVKLIVKWSLKAGEEKLAWACIFTAFYTTFRGLLHYSLHLTPY
jgi:hypothetical protein